MSRKKSVANATPSFDESPRRPWTLGVLVLAAGAWSTWYWYKPLPPEAGKAAYSDWDHTSRTDVWDEAELVKPSLESPLVSDQAAGSFGEGFAELTPSDRNGLLPVPAYKKNLGELVAAEPLPELPSVAPMQVVGSRALVESPSPIRRPPQESLWPDHSYEPPRGDRREEKTLPGIPSLLSSSAPSEAFAIRTREELEGERGGEERGLSNRTTSVETLREETARKPLFIRQPKRSP